MFTRTLMGDGLAWDEVPPLGVEEKGTREFGYTVGHGFSSGWLVFS
jgi:hypothetical protein